MLLNKETKPINQGPLPPAGAPTCHTLWLTVAARLPVSLWLLLGWRGYCPPPSTRWLLTGALRTSWLPDCVSETDHICCGYLCIYNFIMYNCSSVLSFWLSTYASGLDCSHRCILCRKIPDWWLCQKSICNTNSKEKRQWI